MRKISSLSFSEDSEEESLLNLTPLIDVVFIVLIAFILIAPLLQVDKIDLATSQLAKEMAREVSSISVYIRKDGSFWFEDKCYTSSLLKEVLITRRAVKEESIVQLFPDKEAPFGSYQIAKDLLEESGFKEIALMLQP